MVNPLPNDRIPEPKNRRNDVADISLPNTPMVTHTNNMEEMEYQADGHPKRICKFYKRFEIIIRWGEGFQIPAEF